MKKSAFLLIIIALLGVFFFWEGRAETWTFFFEDNLKIGDSGEDVEALQKALQEEGLYERSISGQFDRQTASSVVRFQEKYKEEILAPLDLVSGTGFVSSLTREKLNSLYGTKDLSISTVVVGNVGEEVAELRGRVVNTGGSQDIYYWFEWGETQNLGKETSKKSISEKGDVSERVTRLHPGNTYYYRFVAENEAGTSYGEIKSFTTQKEDTGIERPKVETLKVGNVEERSASLRGIVESTGGAEESTRWFEYGTSENFGQNTSKRTFQGSTLRVTFHIRNLEPETIYYYRFVAENEAGTSYGDTMSFTTKEEEKVELVVRSMDAGTTSPEPGTHYYQPGETVTVKAIPEEGYEFSLWERDGSATGCNQNDSECTFSITKNSGLAAHFTEKRVENGKCGVNATTYGYKENDWIDNEGFCEAGILSEEPLFPDSGKQVRWICLGESGGSNDICTAKASPDYNSKNMELYENKTAFLVSNSDWREVLSLVPVTTWTQNDKDGSRCQRGYGTANNVCIYPTLIFHEEEEFAFDADS